MNHEQSILDEIAADAEARTENIPEDEKLGKLANLAKQLQEIRRLIVQQEEYLKQLEKTAREFSDQYIPQAMAEIGMSKFALDDGTEVQCVPFYNVSINKEHEGAAFDWMRGNNFGDLIKNQVQFNFGAGQDTTSEVLVNWAQQNGLPYSAKMTVHPQTLKAWGKEQLEKGKALPPEFFNLYVGQTTKLAKK